jgi:hypothetical protein
VFSRSLRDVELLLAERGIEPLSWAIGTLSDRAGTR